ncbi:CCA tRNA nucleotidyltransferase [Candidatus Bathyarchaeota archaeon]|nr:CCA tRNA nucleotidyltransferase [Candidatus Bathyarchaeota archaeon]
MESWGEQKSIVLNKIKPKDAERRKLNAAVLKLVNEINRFLKEIGINAVVESHGSVAHDTWLTGESDIDLFIILDLVEGRTGLKKVVDTLKIFFEDNWTEAYAEHPYLQTNFEGYKVDLVPCFRTENGKIASATDRTPLHTKYLEKVLTAELRDEVRLLKQFFKRINVYGAEIKIGGFSGYLTELLIVAYGSFIKTLEAASQWKENEVIILEKENILKTRKIIDPLTLIDPVDKGRNAASPVTNFSKWTFTAAARKFLKKPTADFFLSKKPSADLEQLKTLMSQEIKYVFFVVKDTNPNVSDTLWGQLLKAEKALVKALKDKGFQINRSKVLSDEKKRHLFIFQLESLTIPKALKQYGPPVRFFEDSEKFVDIHKKNKKTLQGPGIENDRWWVVTERDFTDVKQCLTHLIKDGGVSIGIPKKIAEKILDENKIMVNEVLMDLEGFFPEIAKFMLGRPDWLE